VYKFGPNTRNNVRIVASNLGDEIYTTSLKSVGEKYRSLFKYTGGTLYIDSTDKESISGNFDIRTSHIPRVATKDKPSFSSLFKGSFRAQVLTEKVKEQRKKKFVPKPRKQG